MNNYKIEFPDEDHVFINGRQFISLNRFNKVRSDSDKELSEEIKKNSELVEENKHLKSLLKQYLNLAE